MAEDVVNISFDEAKKEISDFLGSVNLDNDITYELDITLTAREKDGAHFSTNLVKTISPHIKRAAAPIYVDTVLEGVVNIWKSFISIELHRSVAAIREKQAAEN